MPVPGQSASIRPAVMDDAANVSAIVDAAYRVYIPRIGKKPGPMLDDYPARIAARQVWILDDGAEILGVLVLENNADGFLLDNIAVAPEHHGQGHGRALLVFAEQRAVHLGWREIRLYTHARMSENIALYRRIGYVETARRTENGFERVHMSKRLP